MATFKEIFTAMDILYRVDEKMEGKDEDLVEDIHVDFIVNNGSYKTLHPPPPPPPPPPTHPVSPS